MGVKEGKTTQCQQQCLDGYVECVGGGPRVRGKEDNQEGTKLSLGFP